ncbi:MAG: ABC transporter ATP-binding protein [Proteobacteria bacterium]|nr:ABC transporter ATP-binding protein [Pseudomonadota bacterium]
MLLLVYPLLALPEAATGLAAKGVFDILQGLETVSILSGWLTLEVGSAMEDRIDWVFYLVGGLMLLHVVHVIPYFAGFYWFVRMQHLLTSLLQKNMLTSVYRRPGAEGLPDSAGEAISRFRGDAAEAAGFIFGSQNMVSNLIVGGAALTLLMHVDPWITSVVFFPLLIVVITARVASARVERYRRASRETTGDVTGAIGELFGAVQAVQVACAENRIIEHFRQFNERRRVAGLKDVLFNNLLGVIFGGVATIGLGVVLLLAGSKLRSGELTAGDFALYQYYLFWILGIPVTIGSMLVRVQQLKVSLGRMQQLTGEDPEQLVARSNTYLWGEYPSLSHPAKEPGDQLQQLEVKGLTSIFPGTDKGIDDVSFRLGRGSLTVITGRVGAGKSTLLRAVLGLLPVDRGEVYWNHERVVSPDSFFVPPRSAYVPQVPQLYSDSLRDNILMGMPEDRVNLPEALRRSALDEIEELLDEGLDTLVGPRGVRLSGGQIQRAAAARMFVRDAELLVFDDLSSALDVKTEQKLWQRIAEVGSTCLVVSHRRAVLRAADQIIVLKDGHVEGIGTLPELLEGCEEMQRIWAEA